ncbi:MAG: alpha/beta hydrolase [Hyphomonadaceae bacterium]|nr:alpha/beta hydrolase [Hyphomonadaceae bacterium]
MFRSMRLGLASPALVATTACASVPAVDVSAMKFVEAAGVRTHVAEWGSGESVLLIHGASSDIGVWEPTIVPALKDRFRVAAYDRPGMGFTDQRPADAGRLDVQAKVATGVIEQLGLTKPIVVGHSWGGAVALRLALDRPDLVGGLVLIAPVAYQWPGGVSWHIYWSSNPLVGGLFNNVLAPPFSESAVRSGLAAAFGPSPVPEGYFEKASSVRVVRPAAMRANSLDLIASKREIIAQQARYPEIKVPVAILAGDSDSVVSSTIHALKLAQTLPNARIDVLQGVGHLPHEASPERFAKLLDWVKSAK